MKTYLTRLPGAALLSLALCVAQSGSTARSAVFSDQAALDQASVFAAQNSIFNPVVRVSVYHDFLAGTGAGGSAVVVGNGDWLLTSGHILTSVVSQGGIEQIRVKVGNDAKNPDLVVHGDSWHVYPGYAGGAGLGVDLALIHLATPINSVVPASLYGGPQSSLTGVPANMCGYGIPGIAGLGLITDDDLKRAGGNIIGDVSYPSVEPQYIVSRFDSPQSGLAVALEWQGSQGDSGGPWMVQDGGIWKVCGISSGGNHDPSFSFGNVTFAMNVSGYLDWINGYVSVPEPSTASLCLLGGVIFLLRRRSGATSVASTPSPPLERPKRVQSCF
jgi:hypothetical protein